MKNRGPYIRRFTTVWGHSIFVFVSGYCRLERWKDRGQQQPFSRICGHAAPFSLLLAFSGRPLEMAVRFARITLFTLRSSPSQNSFGPHFRKVWPVGPRKFRVIVEDILNRSVMRLYFLSAGGETTEK